MRGITAIRFRGCLSNRFDVFARYGIQVYVGVICRFCGRNRGCSPFNKAVSELTILETSPRERCDENRSAARLFDVVGKTNEVFLE